MATNRHSKLPFAPPGRHVMIHPWLPLAVHERFALEAQRKGVSVDKLAAACLSIIARDNLFIAVAPEELLAR